MAQEVSNNSGNELLSQISQLLKDNDKTILSLLTDIQQTVHCIDTKVDMLLEMVKNLQNECEKIKKYDMSVEDKLKMIEAKLCRAEDNIDEEEIESFKSMCQNRYNYWEEYDSLTRNFLPVAEIIYQQLNSINGADYSPVVIELCRALENEWLLKLFRKFASFFLDKHKKDLDDYLYRDKKENSDKTGKFVTAITRAKRNKQFNFTMGEMRFVIQLLTNPYEVSESPLLKDFQEYIKNHTKEKNLLSKDYLKKIESLVENYRNPSAHPELVVQSKAKECKEFMPDRLDYFLECVSSY